MPRNPNKIDYSKSFPVGFEAFASIDDPRNGGNTRHHFGEILFIAFAAILCGVRSYELMEEFGTQSETWLREWFKLPHGIPSASSASVDSAPTSPSTAKPCEARTGLASVIMVHRRTLLGAGKTRDETSYYISSMTDTPAAELLACIRSHWSIENNCHWVLDAIYRQDHNQTCDCNAASNLATMRRMALNAHNRAPQEGKKRKSLPKRELRAMREDAYLEQLMSLV